MCTMSAVIAYRQRYPDYYWTQQTWPPFNDLLRQAEKFDQVTGQPDCVDPEKDAWMKRIEERLSRIEGGGSEPVAVGQPDWEIG